MFSIFTGLGMKPISQPSFTRRPIHQSLLNFCAESLKILEHPPSTSDHFPYLPQRHYLDYYSKPELTSLTWRKSLASKEMAMPGTGTSSS